MVASGNIIKVHLLYLSPTGVASTVSAIKDGNSLPSSVTVTITNFSRYILADIKDGPIFATSARKNKL
jgi:hypothetical protein